MDSGGFSPARLDRLRDVMAAHVARGALPGLVTLVSRRDEVRVDAAGVKTLGGGDPMRRDTIFRIASMTKPVAAVAAMILVEECRLRLDDPVDPLLPELAGRRVLRTVDGALDDTVPARRSISLRDLLTLRPGIGAVLAPAGTSPIQRTMEEAGLAPNPDPPLLSPEEYMERLGALPLIHQPGERWMYETGLDVLGVLISRAAGQPLEAFFRERIFDPLGMRDTGFHVPAAKLDRLPDCYSTHPETGALQPHVAGGDGRWGRPPVFESCGGGLVSTVDDYLAFCRMMLGKGRRRGGERILSRPTVELMITDHLTPEQKAAAGFFFADGSGWGFGMGVTRVRTGLASTPGTFGWAGGYGTCGYADPAEDLVSILMTQRLTDSPESTRVFGDFWTSAYAAIDD